MNDSEQIVHRALKAWAAACTNNNPEEAKLANDFADELECGELAIVVQTRVLGGIVRQESQHVQAPRQVTSVTAPPYRFDVI